VLSAPGMYGVMQTPGNVDRRSGADFPDGRYAANAANIVFGGWETFR